MGNNYIEENYYDNRYQVSKDVEKLKHLRIESPPVSMKNALRIGKAVFFPKNERRRKEILKKYGIK